MDEYGTFELDNNDFSSIAKSLFEDGTVVFPFSGNKIDCQIILMSQGFKKMGVMPFGGNPKGRIYVAIHGKGCGHFNLKNDIHASYISEKLNLDIQNAEHIGRLFGGISEYIQYDY